MKLNKIYNGDCLEVMKTFPDNSIDTILTDPPYHLTSIVKRFGKSNSAPAKYGTDGVFQRSSKGFMGKEWDGGNIAFTTELWKECLRVLKPGGTLLSFGGSRTYHRMACAVEDAGFILKDCIMWLYGSGFPKATDISKQLDKGHKRKVIGRNPNSRENCDKSNTLYESGTVGKTDEITEPATPEAKLWNGWKSHGLKPAYEPIIVAMKPNDGTYANNAIKHGVAGLNIDGGRIPCNDKPKFPEGKYDQNTDIKWRTDKRNKDTQPQGRFPANILLDSEAGKMLDEQSGELSVAGNIREAKINDYNASSYKAGIGKRNPKYHNDKGGASRFFYVAKASKSERNAGCEEIDGNKHPTIKPLT